MKTKNRSIIAVPGVAAFGVSASTRGARQFGSGHPQAPADRAPTTSTEPGSETNCITSGSRRAGEVAARPWRSGLLLGLTAAVLLLGNARAVDLDPVLRGKWPPFPRGPAHHVAVSGHYAYVAAGWQGGLQVIDVSDPANPQRVGGNSSFDGQAVCVGSDHVFVAAGRDGLVILHPFTPRSGPPLSFGKVQAGPAGLDLVLEGLPGLRVDLERSSDLRHWQSWTNTLLGTGPVELTDPEPNPRQFYRAIAR